MNEDPEAMKTCQTPAWKVLTNVISMEQVTHLRGKQNPSVLDKFLISPWNCQLQFACSNAVNSAKPAKHDGFNECRACNGRRSTPAADLQIIDPA